MRRFVALVSAVFAVVPVGRWLRVVEPRWHDSCGVRRALVGADRLIDPFDNP